MSNFLAVATVTETLRQWLDGVVRQVVNGATATTQRPNEASNGNSSGAAKPKVNIYMYQVTPNAAQRNADLPTRREDFTLMRRPTAAVDLHYLLTFYGDEGKFEPQRMLGGVLHELHARPVLTRENIRSTTVAVPLLSTSNLADQVELVRFTPLPLSLEELSKLWSVFFQVPYTLSVGYQASVVLIEGLETPQEALPVLDRNVYVVPTHQPRIEQVISQAGAGEPIVEGGTLVIQGQHLEGDITRVRLGDREAAPAELSDLRITLPLTTPPLAANSLRAGLQGVQVVQLLSIGTPETPHRGIESNVAAFVLSPVIAKDAGNKYKISKSSHTDPQTGVSFVDLTIELKPPVGRDQRVLLLLNEFSPPADRPPRACTFPVTSHSVAGAPESSKTIVASIPKNAIPADDYLVRVQVDGAQSSLDVKASTQEYFAPRIALP